MKKTKLFYGNQYKYITLNSKWDQFKFYWLLWMKRTAMAVVVAWMVTGGIQLGKHTSSQQIKTVYAKETIEVPIREHAAVMDRIAQCESTNMHKKNGQVVFKANTNGTVDIGKYQINSIWNKKASELGLNLTDEKDNEAMAYWIFNNRGTQDWYASASCWQK